MKLAGHRGLPEFYPENSLAGFAAAIAAGAAGIECDVQFNRQGQAFVVHDENLLRVAGVNRSIADVDAHLATEISIHEPQRFADRFHPTPMPTLSDFVALVKRHPEVRVFVEIKEESFAWFPRLQALKVVLNELRGLESQVVIISFDEIFLESVRDASTFPIGWVMHRCDSHSEARAKELSPHFLLCDYKSLNSATPWPGTWEWFVYDVIEPSLALDLHSRGIEWMESWDVAALIKALKSHPKD